MGIQSSSLYCNEVAQEQQRVEEENSAFVNGIRKFFFPLNKQPFPGHLPSRTMILQYLPGCKEVALRTDDGVDLDCLWYPQKEVGNAPTAILIHGNASIADSKWSTASWYHQKGFNVLFYTMRGYPGSAGDSIKGGELGMQLDVEAAVRYVEEKGCNLENTLVHGTSLGAVSAGAAGESFGLRTVFDRPFTSALAMCKRYGKAMVRERIGCFSSLLPEIAYETATNTVFPKGKRYVLQSQGATKERCPELVTNGMSNVDRVAKMQKRPCLLFSLEDQMMPAEFMQDFTKAWKENNTDGKEEGALPIVKIDGDHNTSFLLDEEAEAMYVNYLTSEGFISA